MNRAQHLKITASVYLRTSPIELSTHGPGSKIQSHLGIGKRRDEDWDFFQIGTFENTCSVIFFRERLPQFTGQDLGGKRLVLIHPSHRSGDDMLNIVEVGLHLQRVVDSIVALLEQLFIGHGRMVPIVCFTNRLGQPMGNQCTSRNDTLHHPMIDHRTDNLAHLGNGHRP